MAIKSDTETETACQIVKKKDLVSCLKRSQQYVLVKIRRKTIADVSYGRGTLP